jgi:biopolymer transport protein ExbD
MAAGKQPDYGDDEEGGGDAIFADINITPLTDVFLVMVIIFMVSALAVQAESNLQKKQEEQKEQKEDEQQRSGIKINLPAGQAQEIDTSKASLILTVPLSGNVMVGTKEWTDEAIDNLFRSAYQRDKATQVIIKADTGVQHGRVVNLMERAKQAGLTKLNIATAGGG